MNRLIAIQAETVIVADDHPLFRTAIKEALEADQGETNFLEANSFESLQELVDKSDDILAQEEIMHEKQIMNRFFTLLSTKPGMVSYGEDEVKKNLEMGSVEVVLLSESLEEDKLEDFEELAKPSSAEVSIISTETREGVQLRDIGKIAAILRYEVS